MNNPNASNSWSTSLARRMGQEENSQTKVGTCRRYLGEATIIHASKLVTMP